MIESGAATRYALEPIFASTRKLKDAQGGSGSIARPDQLQRIIPEAVLREYNSSANS
jgi:hypothetical protein